MKCFFFRCYCTYSDALINWIKKISLKYANMAGPLSVLHIRSVKNVLKHFTVLVSNWTLPILRISSVLSHAPLILRTSQILWHIHLIIFQGPMLLSDGCGCYPRSPFSATRPNFRPFQTQQRQPDNTQTDNQRENELISNCRFFYWKKGHLYLKICKMI